MERSVVFAGFGGQGLLFAGQILARAGIKDGLEVFWIPSYGPEMRGGTASCTVILAETEIGSPVVDRFDAAVAMNPPSLAKFAPRVAAGGCCWSTTPWRRGWRAGATTWTSCGSPARSWRPRRATTSW